MSDNNNANSSTTIFEMYNMFWYYPESHGANDPACYFNNSTNTLNTYKIPAIILYPAFLTPMVIKDGGTLNIMLAVNEEERELSIADVNTQLKFTLGLDSYKCVNKEPLFESLENHEIKIEKISEWEKIKGTKKIQFSQGAPMSVPSFDNKILSMPGFKGVVYGDLVKMYQDSGYKSLYHVEIKKVWNKSVDSNRNPREGLLLDRSASTLTGNIKESRDRLNIYDSERQVFKREQDNSQLHRSNSSNQFQHNMMNSNSTKVKKKNNAAKGQKANPLLAVEKSDKFVRRVLNDMNGEGLKDSGKYSHKSEDIVLKSPVQSQRESGNYTPKLQEVYKEDWNSPIQSFHPLFVETSSKKLYNIAHMADLHVSSRQQLMRMSPARVIENCNLNLSPPIGNAINISSENVEEFLNKVGNDSDIDLLLIGGDVIDHVPNIPITEELVKDISGDNGEPNIAKIWDKLHIDMTPFSGLTVLKGLLKGGMSTNNYVENDRYQNFIDLIYFFSKILNFYNKYKKPAFLVSGNHDAYPAPYGLSPRLTDFIMTTVKDKILSFFIGKTLLGILGLSKKATEFINKPWIKKTRGVVGDSTIVTTPLGSHYHRFINKRGMDKVLGRDFINDKLGARFNENIAADHNLTFYEAILLFGESYGQARINSPQIDAGLFIWFFSVFTPFSDYCALTNEQVICGLHWGSDEDLIDPVGKLDPRDGGQPGGHLPRTNDGVTKLQFKLLDDSLKKFPTRMFILNTHFTFMCYKEPIPYLNKERAKLILDDTGPLEPETIEYSRYEMGTFETNRDKMYRNILSKIDCVFTGHSHRRGLYKVTGMPGKERATGAFLELSTEGYKGGVGEHRETADWNFKELEGGDDYAPIIVSDSLGPIPRFNRNGEFYGWGSDYPSGTKVVFDEIGRELKSIDVLKIRNRTTKPRIVVALDYWDILVKKDEPLSVFIDYELDFNSFKKELKSLGASSRKLNRIFYDEINELDGKRLKSSVELAKILNYVCKLDIREFVEDSILKMRHIDKLSIAYDMKKGQVVNSNSSSQYNFNSFVAGGNLDQLNVAILRELLPKTTLRTFPVLGKIISEDMDSKVQSAIEDALIDDVIAGIPLEAGGAIAGGILNGSFELKDINDLLINFYITYSPYLKDNGVHISQISLLSYHEERKEWLVFTGGSKEPGSSKVKTIMPSIPDIIKEDTTERCINHYFNLSYDNVLKLIDRIKTDPGNDFKTEKVYKGHRRGWEDIKVLKDNKKYFLSIKFDYSENKDRHKVFKQYNFDSRWNFPVDLSLEGDRIIIERNKYKAEIPDFDWYKSNFQKYQ